MEDHKITPYLVRNITAAEHQIAVSAMEHMKFAHPGMLDENFEAAFAVMFGLYVEHRELMGDRGARERVMSNVDNVMKRNGPQLRTGKDFTAMAIDEVHRMQLADEDFRRHS